MKIKRADKIPVSRLFHERLLFLNNLDGLGFKEWISHPAMLLDSLHEWWGDQGRRERPHEGLDLCLYRTKEGSIHHVADETKIPVIFEGQISNVTDDFLGESVFVSHGAYDSNERQLHTIYGHVKPGDDIRPGERLSEGDIVGVIAETRNGGVALPHHLHISVAWIPNTMHVQELGWQTINDLTRVVFLDPLGIIEWPYSIMSSI